jgi:hypothetical protein
MNRQIASQTPQQKSTATPWASGLLKRKHDFGPHTIAGGELEAYSKKKRLGLQTKLKVNEPGDIYEQEVDRIADQVMAMPTNSKISDAPPRILRFAGESARQTNTLPASVDLALASPGTPMEPTLRQDMENRFGYDFSQVRVHTGAAAKQSARDLNARAYTLGQDVVFGERSFSPGTQAGRRLIAHELTHVLQQSGSDSIGLSKSDEKRGLPPYYHVSSAAQKVQREETGGDVDVDSAAPITLETGNIGAGFLNNLVHQQICVEGSEGRKRKRCFSFAAIGTQLPQFSSTWLGWDSIVVGEILKGEIYEPRPVSGATIVSQHLPTAAQGARWLDYMQNNRLGLQDGYSVARHNCRTYSQWEFRDAPSHW